MIKLMDVRFGYQNGQEVLKGISLAFDQRTTAIIGQNGAGKTTFVKLLKGLLQPTAGDILIGEVDTKTATVAQLAGSIGLVFQNPHDQIFKRTVVDEVMFGPLQLKVDVQTAKQRAKEALQLVGLWDRQAENPHDLGLSEKKLITIASVVAMNTEVVILDEPTIAQDDAGKRRIAEIIRQLNQEGKLVLAILHDMDFVAAHFERTIVLNQGQVLVDADTRDVFFNRELLQRAGLDTPYVTQLGEKLGEAETVLTAEELIKRWSSKSK
ncbi:ABC transporter ATP-binding protein [Brevibacillus laterosporus]|uniref:Energy-coupling factor transporter ATP-binding protein EcfA2 n=1 Tax=Brevibacillus laterosporus LMG 15441 TaxID=1042163 RepID=A0A075R1W6_BRELA|nr:ABC transporter ATP-binding protein [Brevibacillus laterosporus]AIG25844.1 energy-coupling factor transporter ATP-binding protein EcfA2 [Brevibacillus laterosporus LMG 15441]RJL12877.1 ABC transporter ATP-binding protein [Brevibacillus laterosporus]TPH08213.1 ABC transporter ATP-binding protein [Brevibacillus laterosporus]